MRHGVARGGALVCSLALGAFVIVNAQLGCDAPASTAPPPADAAKVEPATKVESAKVEPAKVEPEANAEAPEPNAAPPAEPEVEPAAKVEPAKAEPVYMPASKSGGDFGAMQFPGQGQINPAPEPPQQQAVQK
jgi:hypothetical protein